MMDGYMEDLRKSENEWIDMPAKPPLHQQVLVELQEGAGQICDVACYIGRVDEQDRWILADVNLDSRQIKRWAHIYPKPPRSEVKKAVEFALKSLPIAAASDLYAALVIAAPYVAIEGNVKECDQVIAALARARGE